MYYEPETYRRERPECDKITHLPTGIVYETMDEAAEAAGVSLYIMRQFIKNGDIWSRPSGVKITEKEVRCVETGEIYPSISKAARAVGGNPDRLSRHLSGRSRGFAAYTWEYTGRQRLPTKKYRKRSKRLPADRITIRDDTGRVYSGTGHVARLSGFTRERVLELVRLDPEGLFRTAWLSDAEYRNARFDGKWWWVNGSIPADTFRKFQTLLRLIGKRVTAGEAKRLTGDLFA